MYKAFSWAVFAKQSSNWKVWAKPNYLVLFIMVMMPLVRRERKMEQEGIE